MNRAAKLDGALSQKRSEPGLPGELPAEVVYRLEKQDMTVKLLSPRGGGPVIEMALGTEARRFSLSEFLHFWLTIIEVGLKRDIAELESGEEFRRLKRNR
jgi:hypothetical protein